MQLAIEIDPGHLFLYEPFWLEGTPFAVNRVVFLMWVATAATLAVFLVGAMRGRLVPRGIQLVAEAGYLFVRNNIAIDVIGPKEGPKYAGYLSSLFWFIFFSNLLEIVPGINFPVTSRLAIPAVLALLSWIIFNFVGIKKQGLGTYLKNTLLPPGVPKLLLPLFALIELFSVFLIRPLTLALRLLANMMAGHVLLTVFFLFTADFLRPSLTAPMGLLTLALAAAVVIFEFLVISIQAYIFTVLTAFYVAEAIHGHGEHDATLDTKHEGPEPAYEIEGMREAAA